ncbi:DNA glycosylase AlkZ-like family protein [Herbidospora yilanensis]|uniref:DNA glycosylase AlkZ-like family protein n=1 Tax=Herbidospora yilanensis TaxID=354426 RepID=UPI0007C76C6A|nr:crosslink repair DNA glycosylase YcaQ family protein [Herbidospora yilanensis]
MDLTWPQVLAWRLGRQFVTAPGPGAVAVAERLCGVQAQVASSAELAISLRLGRAAGAEIEQALWTDQTLIKTWSIRGTLHLLPTASWPVYRAVLGTLRYWDKPSWHRGSGVSAAELDAIIGAVPEALANGPLTREELVDAVIAVTGDEHLREKLASGWGQLFKPLSFLGELCHGVPRGGKVTFTAPPRVGEMSPEEGGVELLRAFLGAHGPASMAAFDGWLFRGLTRRAVLRRWFADLAPATITVEGEELFVLPEHADDLRAARPSEETFLLPGFDQYVMGAPRDLEPLLPAAAKAAVSRTAGWISPVVVHRGRVVGTWDARDGVLTATMLEEAPGVEKAAEKVAGALGRPLDVVVSRPGAAGSRAGRPA